MNDKLRDKILWVLFILIGICTLISVSYAYFVVSGANNANLNISVSAPSCASIDITSGTSINITGEYAAPISDAKALSSDVFRSSFTLKNGCNKEQSLSVLLVPSNSSTMNPKALKYVLIEQNSALPNEGTLVTKEMELSANTQKELLSKYGQTYNVTTGYELTNVSISANEEKSYYLYLWIDYDEGGLGNGITLNTNLTSTLVLGTGTDVATRTTLYSTIAKRYNNGDAFVKLYNGADYGDTTSYANNIYYYTGNVENNNVLFGGYCWKIVRTTDTGGVKMVYNGVQKDVPYPEYVNYVNIEESDYVVLENEGENNGFTYTENKTWRSNGAGQFYFVIEAEDEFQLELKMHDSTEQDQVEVQIEDGTTIYGEKCGENCLVVDDSYILENMPTSTGIRVIYNTGSYNPDSYVEFNVKKKGSSDNARTYKSCNNTGKGSQIGTSSFNNSYNSLAYVGYMYNENKVYTYSSKTIINSTSGLGTKAYGDGATYANNKYTLTNATTLSVSSSNLSTLVGKYTCNSSSTTGTCSSLWYIVGYYGTSIYYYSLSGGVTDGTSYSINYVFGSSFTYANGTYTLTDTVTINSDTWYTNSANVNTHHYTCLTNGNSCTSVYYVYYDSNVTLYYITLTGGKSVNDALNEMLYADDVNTKDSAIKAYIDSWYEKNIKDKYEDKLEDTVFCNDRTISDKAGWDTNGGSTKTYLYFKNNNTSNKNLECTNATDRFSVNNTKARLKYPIGLLTLPELSLAGYGGSHYFNSGQKVWLGSPFYFYHGGNAVVRQVYGEWDSDSVSNAWGVRPAVSIKPGTIISSGDGSYTSPFVID